MTTKPISVKAEMTEDEFLNTFNGLSKARRIRLITQLANRLAGDLSTAEKPTAESSEEELKAWDRFTTIRMEAGYDSTVWSDEMNAFDDEDPLSDTEELIMALFAIERLGRPVRRDLMSKVATKKAVQV